MFNIEKINNLFKKRRILKGHTIGKAALAMNITPITLNRYLRGEMPPHSAKVLCRYLGVKVEDILKTEEE